MKFLLILALLSGCSDRYQEGVKHGRYEAEMTIGADLRECTQDLEAEQEMRAAADNDLFDCLNGARYSMNDLFKRTEP
jgi:hypothetical protein